MMTNKAFSSEIIKKSFVDCGMLDVNKNSYIDIYDTINSLASIDPTYMKEINCVIVRFLQLMQRYSSMV